jgi:broad specificity phosphatase PhoE
VKPALLSLALLLPAAAFAQAPGPSSPVVDAASRLEGHALAEALRKGGFVLFVRHARQVAPQPQTCSEAALTPDGLAQAASLGRSLRSLKIPIGRVRASTLCRAAITALLLDLGPVEETDDLLPSSEPRVQAGRRRQLAEHPPPGTNTLLVSHVQGAEDPAERIQVDFAEVVVFRPEEGGRAVPVARVRLGEWQALE